MKHLHSKRLRLGGLLILFVVLVGALWFVRSRQAPLSVAQSATSINDRVAGLMAQLPIGYASYQAGVSDTGLIGHYLRTNPTAYLTLRYDSNLGSVTRLLRRGTLEHIESEIASFFPTKYGSTYKSLETKHVNVTGRESVDHQFSYTSSSGENLQARIIAIPYSDDVAYYLILQAPSTNFAMVQGDLDAVKDSLNLTGPQPESQAS